MLHQLAGEPLLAEFNGDAQVVEITAASVVAAEHGCGQLLVAPNYRA
jgi:hypothetical protein